eukprot:5048665-Prymnesium_polylepis.1
MAGHASRAQRDRARALAVCPHRAPPPCCGSDRAPRRRSRAAKGCTCATRRGTAGTALRTSKAATRANRHPPSGAACSPAPAPSLA